MSGLSFLHPFGADKYLRNAEQLELECLRVLDILYCHPVTHFLIELAKRRGRLQQLRDLAGIGLKADEIRRFILAETYYPPRLIVTLISQDTTRFVWEIPSFIQHGWLYIVWENFKYRLRRLFR